MKRKKRIVFNVHRSGKIYIAISIILGILAINSGNNFHYLAAASVLGYMAASGEAGKRNIKGAAVNLSFPDEIYAETPFPLTIEVRNTKRFGTLSLLDVEVCGAKAFFPVVQPKEARKVTVLATLPSRGKLYIDEAVLSSVYPFNLFTCVLSVKCEVNVIVFPKPVHDRNITFAGLDEDGRAQNALDAGGATLPLSDSDVVGVRPYVGGDSMRLIHWKSSAKTGALKSRIYDAVGGGKIIDLDSLVEKGLENGLSIACGEIREAILSGTSIGLIDRGVICAASSSRSDKLSMLEALALHE